MSIMARNVPALTRRSGVNGTLPCYVVEKRDGERKSLGLGELLLTVARRLVLQESAARCLHTSRSERLRLHAASWIYRRHDLTAAVLFYHTTIPLRSISPSLTAIPLTSLHPRYSSPLLSTHTHTVSNNTRLPHRTASKVNTILHKTREPIPTAWLPPRHDW
jgi:hypothetical protein